MKTDTAVPKFSVGDKVVLTGVNMCGYQTVEVVKVGRVNVHVDFCARPKAFRIEDGSEVGDYSHYEIYTLAEWAKACRHDELTNRLRAHGVYFDWTARDRLSNDTLARLADILDEHS